MKITIVILNKLKTDLETNKLMRVSIDVPDELSGDERDLYIERKIYSDILAWAEE